MNQLARQANPQMPETITALGFVEKFKQIHEIMSDRRFAFILGAGASKSSGIKLAREMVAEWITTLYRQSKSYPHVPQSTWATAANLSVPGYDPRDPAASYPAFYRRMYAHDPDHGFAYLEDQMAKAEPSYGYSVLGRILAQERHKVVITVNFDNLVADSLSIFSKTYPLVCGHEALVQYANVEPRRPLVLKVHRDLLLHPMSDPDELAQPEPAFAEAVSKLLQRYTPIVIGYGGNDDSLMQCLETLPEKKIPGGVYWCYREEGPLPCQRILDFIGRHHGKLVPIIGFDELMVLLGDALGIGNPDQDVVGRASERAERLAGQFKKFKASSEQAASKHKSPTSSSDALDSSTGGQASDSPTGQTEQVDPLTSRARTTEIDAVVHAIDKLSGEKSPGKRWWQWEREASSEPDLDKRDAIYRAALAELPNSCELLGNYANFLCDVRRDFDAAERMYQRAMESDPNNAIHVGNYAIFLHHDRKDYATAEKVFQRVIEIDPKNADNLGSYAVFLQKVREDYSAAESMYQRALEADPKHANNLHNYANFLGKRRKDDPAAETMYQRAIEADPKHINSLGNYAKFLHKVRKDYDAAESMYQRALKADPKHATILGNYSVFLEDVRKDYEAAESMYQRAIEADSKHANILGNYAVFLRDVRKDYDAAEAMFQRAIEADPKNASHLGNYAVFLQTVRDDYVAAESLYQRALEADPKDARHAINYALFLKSVRKDYDAAESMFQRAIEADPKCAIYFGNYANFLYDIRQNYDAAELMYQRAIEADPKQANNLGNYSRLLFTRGHVIDGLVRLNQAFTASTVESPGALRGELWMYAYCCRSEPARTEALKGLKQWLTDTTARTGEWDFSGVIAQAVKMDHPAADWLPKLAEVLSGRADQSILAEWVDWQQAA